MKKIFIAATKQNDGKTTASLGLICNFQKRFRNVGFIKPIGQRYLEDEGMKIDEDSMLIEEVCGRKCGLKDMSPIAVEKGFTEKYIERPNKELISRQIKEAFRRVAKNQDLVIIEGTGHAGVGSVFDHSNAAVAKLLGAKVIIISSGGIGRPIDEIVLNKTLFEKEGVKVLGVIVNKVLPDKFEKINRLIRKGLERIKIPVLGVVPYEPILVKPTITQIIEETGYEFVSGRDFAENYISKVIVGAMKCDIAIKYLVDDSLLITPGDREDIIKGALGCFTDSSKNKLKLSGVVLTGGMMPEAQTMDLLKNAHVPVLLSKLDTYSVASCIHDVTVKIRPRDKNKINRVVELVNNYVDLNSVLKGM